VVHLHQQEIVIGDVEDWCIDYTYANPTLWLISASGAWYRLAGALCCYGSHKGSPHLDYLPIFLDTIEKFEVSSQVVMCLLDFLPSFPNATLQTVSTIFFQFVLVNIILFIHRLVMRLPLEAKEILMRS
jgi:hypothetical protein